MAFEKEGNNIDPEFPKLIDQYNKWRSIYSYAGQPAGDEPLWEHGRLHFRYGYPLEGWTAYIIEPKDNGYEVLRTTTERHSESSESLMAFFTNIEDAGKYIIWYTGDNLRTKCHLDPIEWVWADAGLDPRVRQISLDKFVSKFELKDDPNRYFVLQAGGVQPENHLLPLTYDELDTLLLGGMPASITSHLT
ncbi:hypothetical protein [Mycobacterium shimoidei]|uniref:Uncharacterized protein n=1 Tax=Mycobacterium shimoidei TaxID=29313 RepID=A0A1E3SQI4_MYCSH|nr:hypothetical protein [Mycobacterium shimoidei]MCV7257081.1 hypothetical protein [Mycobacterium shimoidei]ODR04445.1 hypothetical protein BHQ16_22315 [Mycobacterium shimoidei]ORW77041.1 hypothetical protein AWC26_20135 [Mycobacterium shimoidei]SSA20661.1 hypothetical protein MSP7336_04693 [Mycobacterium shimoidei]